MMSMIEKIIEYGVSVVFGFIAGYFVCAMIEKEKTNIPVVNDPYVHAAVDYAHKEKVLQGRIDSLKNNIDSLKKVKQKTQTIYVDKANSVVHWNNDSTTKFWAEYFGR
jgi:hypothetical protein